MDSNIDTGEARIGLATFSSDVNIEFQLNTYNDRILMADAVLAIPYRQGGWISALSVLWWKYIL